MSQYTEHHISWRPHSCVPPETGMLYQQSRSSWVLRVSTSSYCLSPILYCRPGHVSMNRQYICFLTHSHRLKLWKRMTRQGLLREILCNPMLWYEVYDQLVGNSSNFHGLTSLTHHDREEYYVQFPGCTTDRVLSPYSIQIQNIMQYWMIIVHFKRVN